MRLRADITPPTAIVQAGEARAYGTSLSTGGDIVGTDVRIRYEIEGAGTIERIDTTNGWQCTIAGNTAECTKRTNPPFDAGGLLNVILRAGSDNGSAVRFIMAAAAGPANAPIATSIATSRLQFYLAAVVDTVADSGPGSLRAAIELANSTPRPAKIVFRIPPPVPAGGWFTLIPASPLPPITNERVFVDGKTQTQFLGDTNPLGPEIAIDGRLAHDGLEIHSRCLARVDGLALGNFDGNEGLWFTRSGPCDTFDFFTDDRLVEGNYIGTDPTGTVAWPNRRGLRGDFGAGTIRNNVISGNTLSGMWIWAAYDEFSSFTIVDNRIGTAADGIKPLPNGAAGMLLGDRVAADVLRNVIANHPGMGIALARGETYVRIQQNSMRDNGGIGIDWGIDGTSPITDDSRRSSPNAPTLISARYDAGANRTYFTARNTSQQPFGPDGAMVVFDFYANRGPDGDGEEPINQPHLNYLDVNLVEASVPGDLRGKWINATVTRVPVFGLRTPPVSSELVTFGDESTSEFSNAILVP
ncbi:MAG: right-handed parallel beta-helix repeat-containing protein [Thermoanaerobaculia bacterium]